MKASKFNFTNVVNISSNVNAYAENENINYNVNPSEFFDLELYCKDIKILKYINLFLKRTMDILGAIIGIILLIPITLVIAIANIIIKDNGPLFYSHKRIGKNGKYFKMYKFRSMCVDADVKLKELLESDEEIKKEWEANHKLDNDPRITKIGKFIRKTSLDEVPQFINVLKGEMSLVRTTCCC